MKCVSKKSWSYDISFVASVFYSKRRFYFGFWLCNIRILHELLIPNWMMVIFSPNLSNFLRHSWLLRMDENEISLRFPSFSRELSICRFDYDFFGFKRMSLIFGRSSILEFTRDFDQSLMVLLKCVAFELAYILNNKEIPFSRFLLVQLKVLKHARILSWFDFSRSSTFGFFLWLNGHLQQSNLDIIRIEMIKNS
jgi:hypothetical protein